MAALPDLPRLRLLLQTTQRGWQVVQVAPWEEDDWKVGVADQPEKEIVAYAERCRPPDADGARLRTAAT